jgi:hypothetical protein
VEIGAVDDVRDAPGGVGVAEVDAREAHVAARADGRGLLRVLGGGDVVGQVHDLEVAVQRRVRVDRLAQVVAEHAHRADHHRRGREVGGHLTHAHVPVRRLVQPQQQGEAQGELGEHEHEHVEGGHGRRHLHLGAAQLVGLLGEALEGRRTAAEGLEHADALHGLLDGGGEVAVLVLREAREVGEALVEAEGEDAHRHRRAHEDQREQRARAEQQDHADDDRDDVGDDHDHAEGDPAADQADVAHHAREQLAGAPGVVEGDGQVDDPAVEPHAHLLLDGGRGGDGEHAAQPDQGRLEQADAHDHRPAGPHRGGGRVGVQAVDDPFEGLRDQQGARGGDERAEETEEETDADGADRLPESAHGRDHEEAAPRCAVVGGGERRGRRRRSLPDVRSGRGGRSSPDAPTGRCTGLRRGG